MDHPSDKFHCVGCGSANPPAKTTSAVEENNCSLFIYFTSSFFFKIARSGEDVFGSIFDDQPLDDELANNKIGSCQRGLCVKGLKA